LDTPSGKLPKWLATRISRPQQKDLRSPQIHRRGLQVGFVLNTLEFEAIKIDLRDIAKLPAITGHFQNLIIVREVFLCQRQI
jgi:hypothetical protein